MNDYLEVESFAKSIKKVKVKINKIERLQIHVDDFEKEDEMTSIEFNNLIESLGFKKKLSRRILERLKLWKFYSMFLVKSK